MRTKFLAEPIEPGGYVLVRWVFLRLLGVIYLVAFASFGTQILGLVGSRGILPASEFLEAVHGLLGPRGYRLAPTVFWLDSRDAALQAVAVGGVLLSLALIAGLAHRGVLGLLFIGYLSLVTIGQEFMAFQWDALLLETGFLAIFLAPAGLSPRSSRHPPPYPAAIWLLRWLLFRLVFSSGAVKLLSGDPTWRGLTALSFHFETQPLPTPPAWWVHQLPSHILTLATGAVFFAELVLPLLIFAPRRLRLLGTAGLAGFQLLILATGNYTFFNGLTLALCVLLLDDAALGSGLRMLRIRWRPSSAPPSHSLPRRYFARGYTALMLWAGSAALVATLIGSAPPALLAPYLALQPLRIANGYGLFAVMTTSRPEIIVEGSRDGQTWHEYGFKHKPGDLSRAPTWVAPFQPRLDWQMWFAALRGPTGPRWFGSFVRRLLQGSPEVLALLRENPFPDAPPRYVRATLYDYRFTDLATRRATGDWWAREPLGIYFPASSLAPES